MLPVSALAKAKQKEKARIVSRSTGVTSDGARSSATVG
jgi:hypothetical protein